MQDEPSYEPNQIGDEESVSKDRRPIKLRSAAWIQALAHRLATVGVHPNHVSDSSVVAALVGAGFLIWEAKGATGTAPFIIAAICVQLRLLANVLDGLIAVEGGKKTKVGELYNEIPDRISDVLFLAAAGYASHHGEWGAAIGWSAAVFSVCTAYIRALGARRGQPQDFCGPQGKQHRMFLLTVACLLAAIEKYVDLPPRILFWILTIISAGTLLTCVRRTVRLARQLEST